MQLLAYRDDLTVKKVFGRVVECPQVLDGKPFLFRKKHIPVLSVLEMLEQGTPEEDILKKFAEYGFDHKDIAACKAYQARFLTDTLTKAFHLETQGNVIMIDENMSYFLLPDVVRMFGKSSHVLAEGLVGDDNDDENDIWAHVLEHDYKAVLTGDLDFKHISAKHRRQNNDPNPPTVIYVSARGKNFADILSLLELYQKDVRDFIVRNDAPYATIEKMGLNCSTPQFSL